MSLTNALIAQTLSVRLPALLQALPHASTENRHLYADNDHRRSLRTLLDGAALSGATVRLAFLKLGGELRYMLCHPVQDYDGTCRYYTVQDVELSEEAGRKVYRRVCLDTVVRAQVDFTA